MLIEWVKPNKLSIIIIFYHNFQVLTSVFLRVLLNHFSYTFNKSRANWLTFIYKNKNALLDLSVQKHILSANIATVLMMSLEQCHPICHHQYNHSTNHKQRSAVSHEVSCCVYFIKRIQTKWSKKWEPEHTSVNEKSLSLGKMYLRTILSF